MKVYPVPGRLVRDPRSMQPVPDAGRDVPDDDPYWVRRVRDGDLTETAPAAKAAPAAEPAPAAKAAPAPPIPPRKEA
jgi:hypothetical protein